MGLFNFKRKEAEQIQQELEAAPTIASISREKFTLDSKVEKNELPIFEVFRQLREDWETKGYSDAKAFPETSYRERNKKTIVERLSLLIQESMLKYEDKISEMEMLIDQAEQNGFIETLARHRKQKGILDRHFKELSTLAEDISNIGTTTQAILTSYDMGFARGIASVGEDKVNNIMG